MNVFRDAVQRCKRPSGPIRVPAQLTLFHFTKLTTVAAILDTKACPMNNVQASDTVDCHKCRDKAGINEREEKAATAKSSA